ncbi:MAG: hypothetical protein JRD89_04040 [Deltaproteobacteria bacterium]|nr:hypothetical protein [Deltaproteobacteria bacterium]
MAYNTVAIKKDVNQKPIPQYYNPSSDSYEPLEGRNGASRVLLYDANGNPLLTAVNPGNVKVVNPDAEAVPTKLTGRNVTKVMIFDALAITDTDIHFSTVFDISSYKRISLWAKNTHDQDVELIVTLEGSGFFVWDGTAWSDSERRIILPADMTAPYLVTSEMEWLKELPLVDIQILLRASVAPTSGSCTVFLMGVPN